MQPRQIEILIQNGLEGAEAYVEGDGSHFSALVVSPDFADKSRIQRQRLVYQTVQSQLLDGSLHALSVKTMTPEEWQSIESRGRT